MNLETLNYCPGGRHAYRGTYTGEAFENCENFPACVSTPADLGTPSGAPGPGPTAAPALEGQGQLFLDV